MNRVRVGQDGPADRHRRRRARARHRAPLARRQLRRARRRRVVRAPHRAHRARGTRRHGDHARRAARAPAAAQHRAASRSRRSTSPRCRPSRTCGRGAWSSHARRSASASSRATSTMCASWSSTLADEFDIDGHRGRGGEDGASGERGGWTSGKNRTSLRLPLPRQGPTTNADLKVRAARRWRSAPRDITAGSIAFIRQRPQREAVHRRGSKGGHPAGRSRWRDHRRSRHHVQERRRDRNRRELLARRSVRRRRRPGRHGHEGRIAAREEGDRPTGS